MELTAEDKLVSSQRQSVLKQIKNAQVSGRKNGQLASQNSVDLEAGVKKLPSKKPLTITNQYQDTSVERLIREVTNKKFWQHSDTSRHYQPLPMIKKVIDSMAYAKLNVLNWHIVDKVFSFRDTFISKRNGSYSLTERYSMAAAADIVSYAKRRGINVLVELDVPGHAKSRS